MTSQSHFPRLRKNFRESSVATGNFVLQVIPLGSWIVNLYSFQFPSEYLFRRSFGSRSSDTVSDMSDFRSQRRVSLERAATLVRSSTVNDFGGWAATIAFSMS